MYIKELKINGFKSFADKVNLELSSTTNGIVGPNGSGKSNIVDAIRWVLGEQSVKQLRGTTGMTDVIFGGSKTRDHSSSASVTLVLDNTDMSVPLDYSEIAIKRIVYKTGENEYYINNQKSRLKDITDLFIDSFSSKMNIIQQGKVSEILSNKPEERRIIFEEAAGVLKYKKRKEEALRKLDKTHDNISRVDMIINELEIQIEPLKEQSIKAKFFKEAKEKLESIEVALVTSDITETYNSFKISKEKEEELKTKLTSIETDCNKEEVFLEKLKVKKIKTDEIINETQKKLIEVNSNLSVLSNKKELIKERSKYDKEDAGVKNNLVFLKEKELIEENKIKVLVTELNNIKQEELKLSETCSVLESEFNVESKKKETLSSDYNFLVRKELETKNSIEILENSIISQAKIPYSVKAVLDNPVLSGVIDIIGNVIECDNKFSTMLEVALGGSSNFIIVENQESAKNAIDYLKNNNKGRATFFPISVIKPKGIDSNVLNEVMKEKGFVGVASDLVSYDKKFYSIVMNQLGNIIVCENLSDANNISKIINHKYRVVTLDGQIIHVGGSITGGSNNSKSVISDKFNLENLKSNYEKIGIQKKELGENIKSIDYNIEVLKTNIMSKNVLLVGVKEKIYSKEKEKGELDVVLDSIKNEIKDLSLNTKEKIDKSIKSVMEEYYKEESVKNKLESVLEFNIKESKEINESINDKEVFIKKNNSIYSSLNNELKELEIKNTKSNMIVDSLLNKLSEEYNITYEKAKNEYVLEMENSEARNLVNDLRKKIKSLGEVNLGSIEEYERINKRYSFLTQQKEDLLNSQNNLLEIINQMDETMIDKFATTFSKINKEFNNVFKTLFNGGSAEVRLTEPNNVLETGIEILANPPGKKPSVISLLSGGEKTLTAISLLFSVVNLSKVPFLVLDEVESALDEVNVEKFGNYLNKYKNKTQLILITHKKKTMEYVDQLYGVTMQESGVSKLVSVKLQDI